MTLYLLFEQLDKGALTLQSANSDLGTRGRTGAVEIGHFRGDKSSVDERKGDRDPLGQLTSQVAIAEAVGGDESTLHR